MNSTNISIKSLLLVLTICSMGSMAYGQDQTKGITPVAKDKAQNKGVTRAVVVGISDYQNDQIPDLQYADKDAELFAEYLKSPAGGNVPDEHVTVLLNEDATSGKFVAALYGLVEDSSEGDMTMIYFSGHGDVESSTISQPGFLLCWDAPPRIYMGGGTFGLSYLQEIISTISEKTKSKVVVITDACRAGKLAGSKIGGAQATAANLAKQYANEIKILSCQPNEFALESKDWGGGRGVFSYFFLAGIQGLADKNNDNIVTLTEIDRYLEDNVTPAAEPHSQIPLVVGNRQTEIAVVTPEGKTKAKALLANPKLGVVADRSLALGREFFSDTTKYNTYIAFTEALEAGHLLYPEEGSAWTLFQEVSQYEEVDSRLGLMKRNLAAALQDDAQQAINRYLSADSKELKRRKYYDSAYEVYPEALSKAASLLSEDHFYYKPLMSRYYYFMGLNTRLKGQRFAKDSLYEAALLYQDTALTYEPQAVHCINEIGYTHFLLKDYDTSTKYFEQALELIPSWPLVWVNISTNLTAQKRYTESIAKARKAIELDSLFSSGYYNLASAYQQLGDTTNAFQVLDLAMVLFPDHPYFYYKVAYMSKQTNAAKAEEYYLTGINLEEGKDIDPRVALGHLYLENNKLDKAKETFLSIRSDFPDHIKSYQVMIEYSYHIGDLDGAAIALKDYVKAFPYDGYAYYLLASIAGSTNSTTEALDYIQQAFEHNFDQLSVLEKDSNLKSIISTDEYETLKAEFGKE